MKRVVAVGCLCVVLVLAGCMGVGFPPTEPAEAPTGEPTDEPSSPPPTGTFEVHAINVGQADATLLRTDEETMLIDSGDWRDDGETVIEYLDAHGVDRIDHLISTHAHADHIGGHEAVIDHYETEREGVGAVYDSGVPSTSQTYERYLDSIDRHDVTLFEVRENDEIPFSGTRTVVRSPPYPPGDSLNDNSVAVIVAFGDTTFLFTGDAERDMESRMVDAHGDALEADVYHAGHHGSNTSSSAEFLDVVGPEIAIVSAAYDSPYGHPHDEPLERFAERDIRAVWTATHGSIVFESDGTNISVRTQHEVTMSPLELDDASEATAKPTAPATERTVIRPASTVQQQVQPRTEVAL
ncbi:MAG: MBL fold metallo-hydrolase [Halobacteriota archaeon]|uniref:MBL fold metallo-hydrolase n=1 Tax=Natronomonas sp. TaxID=2184060 RepID=UPI003974F099